MSYIYGPFSELSLLYGDDEEEEEKEEEVIEETYTRKLCIKGKGSVTKAQIYTHLSECDLGKILEIELFNGKNNQYYSSYCDESYSKVGFTAIVSINEKLDTFMTLHRILDVQKEKLKIDYYYNSYWYLENFVSEEQIDNPLPGKTEHEDYRNTCTLKQMLCDAQGTGVDPRTVRIGGSWSTFH
tara:strand:+ start:856 stop:1407 length:552 start_codon:yes stop_codon:yes gene_type:complete